MWGGGGSLTSCVRVVDSEGAFSELYGFTDAQETAGRGDARRARLHHAMRGGAVEAGEGRAAHQPGVGGRVGRRGHRVVGDLRGQQGHVLPTALLTDAAL